MLDGRRQSPGWEGRERDGSGRRKGKGMQAFLYSEFFRALWWCIDVTWYGIQNIWIAVLYWEYFVIIYVFALCRSPAGMKQCTWIWWTNQAGCLNETHRVSSQCWSTKAESFMSPLFVMSFWKMNFPRPSQEHMRCCLQRLKNELHWSYCSWNLTRFAPY